MNVLGCGCDLVYVPDFSKRILSETSLQKLFSPGELQRTDAKHVAGLFAVKEAVLKATRLKAGDWHDIVIRPQPNAAPLVSVKSQPKLNFQASISHDGDYALAFVIALQDE